MTAYYNEIDPYAAQWLRNLIAAGHIAPGVVDERSIEDVRPSDLAEFTQCHFFAGIGGWSYALRIAGWPDEMPVWTGSCPCQPFSAAGKGVGAADERHLWPAWHHLIRECKPTVIFGEQVEAAINHGWLDLVQDDLEGEGYAFGAVGLPAASVGAPHIRQRLWFVAERMADAGVPGPQGRIERGNGAVKRIAGARGMDGGLADTLSAGRPEWRTIPGDGQTAGSGEFSGMADTSGDARLWTERRGDSWDDSGRDCATGGMANAAPEQHDGCRSTGEGRRTEYPDGCATGGMAIPDSSGSQQGCAAAETTRHGRPIIPAGSANQHGPADAPDGFWRAADWLYCRDGKWRPVESGTFPLAHGVSARVGRLRAYGNAIVPQVAAEVIQAYCLS